MKVSLNDNSKNEFHCQKAKNFISFWSLISVLVLIGISSCCMYSLKALNQWCNNIWYDDWWAETKFYRNQVNLLCLFSFGFSVFIYPHFYLLISHEFQFLWSCTHNSFNFFYYLHHNHPRNLRCKQAKMHVLKNLQWSIRIFFFLFGNCKIERKTHKAINQTLVVPFAGFVSSSPYCPMILLSSP